MYSILVSHSSEYKKAKGVNKHVVAKMNCNKYKGFLLNKKCLRHSMDRTQSKINRIGTSEMNKIYLLCFDEKNLYLSSYKISTVQSNQNNLF